MARSLRRRRAAAPAPATVALLASLAACGAGTDEQPADSSPGASTAGTLPTTGPAPTNPEPTTPTLTSPAPTTPAPSPEPRRSFVTIEAIGMVDLPVVRYRGSPDDAPGTRIQDRGEMASPLGPRGGVGPGEVGNFIITGHRLTGAAPLRDSPSLRRGDTIVVRSGDTEHTYEVVRTRETSFRSPASLAAQRAPTPGRPGVEPTKAYLALSTCATLEDHAEGNYWKDEFDNPEHRIDKIAVLRSSRAVG